MNPELQIAKKNVNIGLLTEKELLEAVEIQKLCKQKEIHLPLAQIVIKKYITGPNAKDQYLQSLVQQLEIPSVRKYLDPYGMEMSEDWKKNLERSRAKADDEKRSRAQEIENQFKKMELPLDTPHILLLQSQGIQPKWPESFFSSPERIINLDYFCQRKRKRELLQPNTKVSKLSGGIVSMEEIEAAIMLQKESEKTYRIEIPMSHILIGKYGIEPYLLHALIISQLDWQEGMIESWLGGMLIQKIPDDPSYSAHLRMAQNQCKEFLETQFRWEWLEFNPEEESMLLEHFKKDLSKDVVEKNIHIQSELAHKKFDVSLLKIMAFRGDLPSVKLVEGVMSVLYKISSEQVAQLVKPIEEAISKEMETGGPEGKEEAQESPDAPKAEAPKRPPKKFALGSTMAISQEHMNRKGGSSGAGSKIIERLKKTKSEPKPETPEKIEKPPEVQKEPVDLEEKSTPTEKLSTVSLTEDMARIYQAYQEKLVREDELVESMLLYMDLQKSGSPKPLLEILLDRHLLTKEAYSNLLVSSPRQTQIKVPKASSDIDLALANMLIEYSIIARDQTQKMLHLQNSLNHLGIRIPLDQLLIKTRSIAAEMVQPLVAECHRRKEKKSPGGPQLGQTMRVDTKAQAVPSKGLGQTMRLEGKGKTPEDARTKKEPLRKNSRHSSKK